MHIDINDNTRLKDIQKTFSDYYPFLSINFYNEPHVKYQSSPATHLIDPQKKIIEVRKTHISTLLEIQPHYRVADVEREFLERLGLSVQVMKKENEEWQQTTGLDNLTLRDLNMLGRNSSDEFIVEDYDQSFEEEL
jgi:hypothetical protein